MTEMPFWLRPLFLGFVVVLLDCASLDKLPEQTCGNGVVDSNEDCDTFPNDPKAAMRCGGPSEGVGACRLRCGKQPDGATPSCPAGWGCSVAGVCRAPTGTFAPALAPVSAGVLNLEAGDFDGDGRRDLVGSGPRSGDNANRVRVHYFDDSGALAQVVSLPSQLISPVVFDQDGDGRDDIGFGIAQSGRTGLGVMSGLQDRTFLPVGFPFFTITDTEAFPSVVFATSDLSLPNGSATAVLLVAHTSTGSALNSLEGDIGVGPQLNIELQPGPLTLHGRPATARLFDLVPNSICSELVVAVDQANGPKVLVFSPCMSVDLAGGKKVSRWNDSGLQTLDVPAPFDAKDRGVLLADWSGDGRPDLIVEVGGNPYFAYNDGTRFGPLTPASASSAFRGTPLAAGDLNGDGSGMPLAAGDLNGDGRTDFVFSRFIATSKAMAGDAGSPDGGPASGGGFDVPAFQQQQDWTGAVIGRFNDDSFLDVVTMREGSPDLELYAGSADGLARFTITTDGVVQSIAKGDFDGDHVEDIAVVEASSIGKGSDLAIAYGRALGAPEPAKVIGRVDALQGIAAIPRGPIDGLTDLGVVRLQPGSGAVMSTSFSLLLGSGDRQNVAPLLFLDKNSLRPLAQAKVDLGIVRSWVPVSLVAGTLSDPLHSAMLSYAVGLDFNIKTGAGDRTFLTGAWVAAFDSNASGGLDPPKEVTTIDDKLRLVDPATREVLVSSAARDVDGPDGDHLAEVLVLANLPGQPDPVLQVIRPNDRGSKPPPAFTLAGLRVTPGAQLDAFDLDGDGYRDVVAVFGVVPNTEIHVFFNDRNGGFILPGIAVTLGAPAPGEVPDGARAFAPITVGGAQALGGGARTTALALVTGRDVLIATLRPDRSAFDPRPLEKGLIAATGIAAGDFNGDGVEDIAVADAGSVKLLLQYAMRPRP